MLKNIKTIKCPICGCVEVVSESVDTNYNQTEILQHCNGTRWEHRKFLCGYHIEYIPNFSKECENKYSECKNSPEVIKKREKEKKDKDRIISLLEENNISNELIDRVKMHCLY